MRTEIKEENPVLLDVLGVSRDMPRLGHAAVQYRVIYPQWTSGRSTSPWSTGWDVVIEGMLPETRGH